MKHPRLGLAAFALILFVIDSGLHLRAAHACESCYSLVHTLHLFVPTSVTRHLSAILFGPSARQRQYPGSYRNLDNKVRLGTLA
ncbi:hypothetical protein B0H14DRAFT_2939758, partial [Mycena olivaceomarginata]